MRKRNTGIYFRVTEDEKAKLDDMLNASDLSLAEFIRYTLFGYPKPIKIKAIQNA